MNWRKGPPPSIGWWPASFSKDPNCLRWWNGHCWSIGAYEYTAAGAEKVASLRSDHQDTIEWTDRPAWWPERSKT